MTWSSFITKGDENRCMRHLTGFSSSLAGAWSSGGMCCLHVLSELSGSVEMTGPDSSTDQPPVHAFKNAQHSTLSTLTWTEIGRILSSLPNSKCKCSWFTYRLYSTITRCSFSSLSYPSSSWEEVLSSRLLFRTCTVIQK